MSDSPITVSEHEVLRMALERAEKARRGTSAVVVAAESLKTDWNYSDVPGTSSRVTGGTTGAGSSRNVRTATERYRELFGDDEEADA